MTAPRTCPHCGAHILRGLDSPTAGIPVTLDATPVDNLGELLAITQGRTTYDISTTRDGQNIRRVIEPRTPRSIASPINHLLARRVHAEHRCGQPLPAAPAASSGWNEQVAF